MKILFCEVENYGKISGRKIVFDGNLPQFCEDNGKGKTTLCSFLRVMFYGMETRREKATESIFIRFRAEDSAAR